MTRAAVVQYHTTTVSTERNRQLVEDLLDELAARDPGGLDYLVFRFDDGVGFMHVAVFDGTTDPFAECTAYRKFHRELGDRLAAAPIAIRAMLIGSYPGTAVTIKPKAIVVQYRTRPDAAERNQQLIERVFEELRGLAPRELRYMAFRLEDGVGFVHVAIFDGDDPLAESAAFRRFQEGTAERLVGPPDIKSMTVVGLYRGRYIQKEHQ